MWMRNTFFVALIISALVGLGWMLYPPAVPPRAKNFDAAPFEKDEFRSVVKRVDDAIREQQQNEDLEPAPIASEFIVARRLSLALTGSIPSLQEVRQFENYKGRERIQWWLQGTLEDRRFSDYFAERFARAYVGTEMGPFLVYRRRRFVSWLSDELHKNRPYNQIVQELISSDGIWTDKPATNFLTATADQNKNNKLDPERLAAKVARAFLGVRLDCAQCHDHPFEKWKQRDFQGLAAFFGQTRLGFTGAYDDMKTVYEIENRKSGEMEKVVPGVPDLPGVDNTLSLLGTDGTQRRQLAVWVTHPRNPFFARALANRVWALMFGRPMLEYVDDVSSVGEEHVPKALRILAEDFVEHNFDLRRIIRVIAATEAFRRDSAADHEITDAHEKTWAAFPLTRLRPEQVVGSVQQAASLTTIDADSHILVKLGTATGEKDFVTRYGDTGDDEFDNRGGTIPQRLLLMNGQLVHEKTKQGLFNAATRIGWQAPNDREAVRTAYLTVLTREPTEEESRHFQQRLGGTRGDERSRRMEDIYWALINSTEFSWNH